MMLYSKLKTFIRLFFILLCLEVNAQNENLNLILFAKKYEKGFYRTFEEFRKNAPSIPFEGEINNYQAVYFNFHGHPPCPNQTPIWGFCDGTGIYIANSAFFSDKVIYYRILFIGRFCDYQINKDRIGIDFNTGKSFIINKATVEYFIEKDEELYTSFIENKKRKLVALEYLRYYSKKHLEEVDLVKVKMP